MAARHQRAASLLFYWIPACLFLVLFCWVFGEALFLDRNFVYGDTANFFYPIFRFVQHEWSAGRVPLWNPYDECGFPMVANPTWSIFYPGKLIFFLPIPFDWSYKFFTVGHVLLAGFFAYRLSRYAGASLMGATICALSYAFCGDVLRQHMNLPFLISAAWLPAAIGATDRMLRKRSFRWAVVLGAVMAMMVLGGDAQMAYNVMLLAGLHALVLAWHKAKPAEDATANSAESSNERELPVVKRIGRSRVVLLGAAAFAGLLLSAIQILPTLEWTAECVRGQPSGIPRNIYEFVQTRPSDRLDPETRSHRYDGLLGKPLPPPSVAVYAKSVDPWRMIEFIWPGINGRDLAQNRRWLYLPENRGALWVPSLYRGLLPIVLGLCAWRVRRTTPLTRWLSLSVLLAVLASFGTFGIGWCLRKCFASDGPEFPVGDPFGGLYWLMTMLLPGYASFRYPAKLMVIAAIGLSVLAGTGWDQITSGQARWPRRALLATGLISLLGALALFAVSSKWSDWLADHPRSIYFGPFDSSGALFDSMYAMIHALIVSLVLAWLVWSGKMHASWGRRMIVLVVVVCDLALANGWMVQTAPAEQWHGTPAVASLIARAEEQYGDEREGVSQPFRAFQLNAMLPRRWGERSSPDRVVEGEAWRRDVLFPKYHLPSNVEMVDSPGTFRSYDLDFLLKPAKIPSRPQYVRPRQSLDALNTKYFILPPRGYSGDSNLSTLGLRHSWSSAPGIGMPSGPPLRRILEAPSVEKRLPDVEVLFNQDYLPRAWIVHDILVIRPVDRASLQDMYQTSRAIAFPDAGVNPRTMAIVESTELPQGRHQLAETRRDEVSRDDTSRSEPCRIAKYDPNQVEVELRLDQPGMLVLSDMYEKNWTVHDEIGGEPRVLEIHRTNLVMRGVMLDAGEHRLVFRYTPARFHLGAMASGGAWSILVLAAAFLGMRKVIHRARRKRPTPTS